MDVKPCCNNCAWMSQVSFHGKVQYQYCDNEDSPRGDEDVEQGDTCDCHEFKEGDDE